MFHMCDELLGLMFHVCDEMLELMFHMCDEMLGLMPRMCDVIVRLVFVLARRETLLVCNACKKQSRRAFTALTGLDFRRAIELFCFTNSC